jgi:hemerythrin-like metal-binding protein
MSTTPVKILEWTPQYSVQVETIDREHQIWFDLVNGLHQAMLVGKGSEILATLLAQMTQYTVYHFAHEEELMAASGYPEMQDHVQQHNELRETTMRFVERFERGEIAMTIELTLFLSQWIRQHTMTIDRRLGEYLSARGNEPLAAPRLPTRH